SYNLPDPYEWTPQQTTTDTIPLKDRYGNWVEDPSNNPFDLLDPVEVVQDVEYDPVTNSYILTEKIGNENYRPPTVMTYQEYLDWNSHKEEGEYFKQLAGAASGDRSKNGHLDPVSKVDISDDIIDRLFGGTKVDIRPQGNVDLTFGFDYYRQDNPILPIRQQRRGPSFDFDMDIQVDVNGQIGEKLKTAFNYNTSRTFDFQNRLKLDYNSDLFSEDEILKSIEAGDVSLPLKSTLIKGSQALFGLKTELQFGHLRLTAIASQQNSKQNDINIQGGSVLQEFEIYADQYDENRHFFLSHYNRNTFEKAVMNLPQINSLFHITRMDVWVTNDRNQTTDVRDVVAIADLGEWHDMTNKDPNRWRIQDTSQLLDICMTGILPDNRTNKILGTLRANPANRDLDNAVKTLQNIGFESPRDYEKIQGRKLNSSEYRYNPELGFISLNIRMDQDEVIGVAYEYTYNGKVYQVGELSQDVENTDTMGTQKVLFVKLLKGTNQRVDLPLWDLMMKNVYRIGGGDLNKDEFELDVFYEHPGKGFKRFLPAESKLESTPLLNIFNLDNLNVTGDPQPDGRFDFVEGVTITPSLGIVMFPVLEPFGSTLKNKILKAGGDPKFVYQQLYDSTIVKAREFPELNRFTLKGKAKTSTSSDISLGAFNIPPGSVRVTAGGQVLKENEDYTIDYNIGRIKILNQAFLQPGTPINVSFEDNALFSFNKKTMLGLRADYTLNKHISFGATYMHLFERPYTQKVNIGDDPINNTIYGLDFNYSNEAPWLTKLVDKIPFINTSAPSNVTFAAEVAALKPSHSRAIDKSKGDNQGVVYLDDFEGTTSNFDLRTPTTAWILGSTPQNENLPGRDGMPATTLPESALINDLRYGMNRAHINWYRIDQGVRNASPGSNENPYTRAINQNEIFRNRTPRFGLNDFRTFDITYIPDERGPYNFDPPGGSPGISAGIDPNCKLIDPYSRWGGIMRSLNQTNFEQANIEAVEFWVLDPYILDDKGSDGKLVLQLGNVSEDILRDSRKFYEHGLPLAPTERVDTTVWGRVPRIPATVNAFSNEPGAREIQDVGLDGLNDAGEKVIFSDYLNKVQGFLTQPCLDSVLRDPSNDDFEYFLDDQLFPSGTDLFTRYKKFNGTERNSPPPNSGATRINASTNIPDSEDINNDNSLSENESYYEYVIDLKKDPNGSSKTGHLDTLNPLITDKVWTPNGTWYRFKIPLDEYNRSVNGISDFRSIRFMRMLMTQFTQKTTLRFATLDLVRNQWRRLTKNTGLGCTGDLVVDAVNIEEHTDRIPFHYDIPLGIQRERITSSTFQDVFQNEQSLSLKYSNLNDGCDLKVYKSLDLDLRVFKNVQMFVHAEEADSTQISGQVPNGAVKLFMRFGSDFDNNYYEYEVPLVESKDPSLTGDAYKKELWRGENELNFALEDFTNLKIERNKFSPDPTVPYEKIVTVVINGVSVERVFRIKGNPTLGYVRNVLIGLRNPSNDDFVGSYSGEVWVNELRLVGLEEKGGVAGLARLDADLADFGSVGLSGTYSSIGWGAIDQKLDDRSKEAITQMDFSTTLQLGKFFGTNSKIQIPFYYQYSQTVHKPKYDALDLDLLLKEKLRSISDSHARDSVKEQSQDFSSLSQISFTNVRKDKSGTGPSMPWDISNFTTSYSYSKSNIHNEVVQKDELDQHRGSLDYTYTINSKPIQPLKNLSKSKWLMWLTELNFNPIPNSFTFGTVLDRKFGERSYRFSDPIYKTWFDKRFTWERSYTLRWDFTKSIKFTFNALNNAVIDEPDEYVTRSPLVPIDKKVRNDSIWSNIKKFGRTKDYAHQIRATYALPFKNFPILDWIRTDLSVDASYGWKAASINTDSLGNVIQNGQTRQISADLDFTRLYGKIPLLAKINKPGGTTSANRGGRAPAKPGTNDPANKKEPKDTKNQKDKKNAKDNKDSKEPIITPPDTTGNKNVKDSLNSKDTKSKVKNQPKDKESKAKDKESKAKDKKKKKQSKEVNPVLKAILRPIMSVRKLRVNYGETVSTTIPGFTPQSRLLGMSSGFGAPGWDFVAGIQPKINRRAEEKTGDWLANAQGRSWITTNAFQNAPILQSSMKNLDGKLTLEPFTDFKIDVDASRNVSNNFSEFFKTYTKGLHSNSDIDRRSPREIGSFSMSYLSIPTLFRDDSLQLADLFHKFEENRAIISRQRGVDVHETDGPQYAKGFGRKQQDVLVPAFLSAYTNKNPENFNLTDMFKWVPRPNWTINYNGLSKLPFLKDIFSNIRISHGYKNTLSVNSFESDLSYTDYDPVNNVNLGQQNSRNLDTISHNYYSQFLLPSIIIEESFSPLIGIDIKTKNDMNISFSYTKKRGLAMGFISYELAETRSTTLDFGFDWKMKNVRIGFLPGFNSAANKKKASSKKEEQKSNAKRGNDLDILFDLSFADNLTLNHLLDQEAGARATRGSKDITISPAIRYDINKNVNLRFFVDFRKQEPYVSNSYKVVTTEGGLTIRISLE
ncbi:MAG: cell surface protein SprA, partial [Saprospiraceae bacterium]